MLSVDFLIWVVLLRNQLMSGGFCPLKSKLGGYAPEWVAMLRNRAAPEGRFGGKITTLGGFAPENSTVPKPPKLGGHAPEHPPNIGGHIGQEIITGNFTSPEVDTIWAIERVDTVKDAHRLSPVATARSLRLVAIVRGWCSAPQLCSGL